MKNTTEFKFDKRSAQELYAEIVEHFSPSAHPLWLKIGDSYYRSSDVKNIKVEFFNTRAPLSRDDFKNTEEWDAAWEEISLAPKYAIVHIGGIAVSACLPEQVAKDLARMLMIALSAL